MSEAIENTPLAKVLSPASYFPMSSAVVLAVLRLPELDTLVSPLLATHLLSQWGLRTGISKDPANQPLLDYLFERGANPWLLPALLSAWVKNGETHWLATSLNHPEAKLALPSYLAGWLKTSVEADALVVVEALLKGAGRLLGQSTPANLFPLAPSAAMVSLLLSRATPEAAFADQPRPLVEAWFNDHALSHRPVYSDRAHVLRQAAMTHPDGIYQRAFDALPALLAASGDYDQAIACADLTRCGFGNAPSPLHALGMSPLGGWALSILGKNSYLPSTRPCMRVLERAFRAREDTWDSEWVLAASAVQFLNSHSKGRVDALAFIVNARRAELCARPGLAGGPDRWTEAAEEVLAMRTRSPALGYMASAAFSRAQGCFLSGQTMCVPWGSAAQMNTWLEQEAASYQSRDYLKQSLVLHWAKGVPDAFLAAHDHSCPAWLLKLDLVALAPVFKAHMEKGEPAPRGLPVPSTWPSDMRAWAEQGALLSQSPPSPVRPRPRM